MTLDPMKLQALGALYATREAFKRGTTLEQAYEQYRSSGVPLIISGDTLNEIIHDV